METHASSAVRSDPLLAAAIVVASVAGWAALAWLSLDMGHPLAQLTMPGWPHWTLANVAAVFAMWAVMMAAMMLPSAWPMTLTFVGLSAREGRPGRGRMFVVAYLVVWTGFSIAATALQWALQALDWVDMMIVSTSGPLSALLLAIAGIYQFSPLKRMCLARCRAPMSFLIADWRPGARGAFLMGLHHGLLCAGCCWALMALLFVGGAMNLGWVAAVSVAVAIEKLAPHGERIATILGVAMLAAGAAKLAGLF
ncbi:MAG TPA: DUF2182 domain-containing protein [Ramlibacter sp.]|jgi:predicted metal-binding membrane protein|nr:DUF2182 domain-containing protein [Ramlibacter sp.]